MSGPVTSGTREYLQSLPFLEALLPLLTINVCYLIASHVGHVPSCIPYIEGCTSVSSTGRTLPEAIVFKAGMFATAIVLVLLWLRAAAFLRQNSVSKIRVNLLQGLACVATVSLVVYAITLGMDNAQYGGIRQAATRGYAIFGTLTMISFALLYRPLQTTATRALYPWLVLLSFSLPLIGLVSETVKLMNLPSRAINYVAAWNAFVAASLYYLVLARVWQRHRISSGLPASPRE